MATAQWAARGSVTTLSISTTLNSLANGAESDLVEYDNGTALDLYAIVTVALGSFTPGSSPSVGIRHYYAGGSAGTTQPDKSGDGDLYVRAITTGAGAKTTTFRVQLVPGKNYFSVVNLTNAAFASSGHNVYVQPFNESVA
jgi:hypothetical protein